MSFTRLRYHIVFTTKEREPWLTREVEEFVYPVVGRIAKLNRGCLLCIGGVEDHVHLLVAISPTMAVAEFVRAIKASSSAAIRKKFSSLRGFRWQGEYSCFTVWPKDYKGLVRYIENQKEHHRQRTTRDDYEVMVSDKGPEPLARGEGRS